MTGASRSNKLVADLQNYLVVPNQPWLDGFSTGKGLIRQFVAMPLEAGFSVKEQLTGAGYHGGLQIAVYPMKASVYEAMSPGAYGPDLQCHVAPLDTAHEMGLAPGGLMRQEICEDEYGFAAWDRTVCSRCFVHILNSVQYFVVTGEELPCRPPTAMAYTRARLPWFEFYRGDRNTLAGGCMLDWNRTIHRVSFSDRSVLYGDFNAAMRVPTQALRRGNFQGHHPLRTCIFNDFQWDICGNSSLFNLVVAPIRGRNQGESHSLRLSVVKQNSLQSCKLQTGDIPNGPGLPLGLDTERLGPHRSADITDRFLMDRIPLAFTLLRPKTGCPLS